MGIRKVNGASTWILFTLLAKEFLMLIGISVLISIPISWYVMNEWLKNYAFRTSLNPLFFLIAALILFAVSMFAIGWRIYKTASSNPVVSLKNE